MKLGTWVFIWRRRLTGILRRAITRLFKPKLIRNGSAPPAGNGSKMIWCTQVVANRPEELEIARRNLERLEPVIAWASLTVDGTPADADEFSWNTFCRGFQNVIWLSRPEVVSRSGHCATYGHFNRHTLNYLRGWMANLEVGEECRADLFCHNDGDWELTIRPESLERLTAFFHRYPQVAAITRNLDNFLMDEPCMWADKESDGELWFGRGMLSSNLVISPIERIRPIICQAWEVFPHFRGEFLEQILRRLVVDRNMVIAYPKQKYFREQFLIDLVEKREPFPSPVKE